MALLLATVLPVCAFAQDATSVYERFSAAVAKVEVLERNSSTPASVGTAFFATPSLLVTNYHVVRDVVFDEDSYELRLMTTGGTELPGVRIVGVDPASDLAALRIADDIGSPLSLALGPVPNGEVLYSLGHPGDLRTSVVEGVFNGDVEAAVAPLMHFSGSINPGMSGGPTVRASGAVVGVNVSTAGNQMSFLVPAELVGLLIESATSVDSLTTEELKERATASFRGFQDRFFGDLIAGGLGTTTISSASLPAPPEGELDCSASPHEVEDDRYEIIEYRCYSEDGVLLGPQGIYDLISMEHIYLAAGELNRFKFNSLVSEWFNAVVAWETPVNEDATRFRCRRSRLGDGVEATVLASFCTRRHKAHPGLHDLIVRSVARSGSEAAVVSTLRASPISFEHATALARAWLSDIGWMP